MSTNENKAAGAGHRPTILIIDDEEINRMLIRSLLEAANYRVDEAGDGATALAGMDERPPDLVLLDVVMPGMDGFETCRRIKARQSSGFLPVLMLTSLAEQSNRNAGLLAGADDFLTKPVDPVELVLRVAAFSRIRQQEKLLRMAVENLRQLDSLKSDLFSLVVHDLRNPLNNCKGYIAMLRESLETPGDRQKRFLEGADRSAADMTGLLEGVLDVTLLERGELKLTEQEVDLAQLGGEAVESFAATAALKNVRLELATDGPAVVRGDRRLLRRCLDNLLANALRYAPKESAVQIGARAQGPEAWIEVADQGPGVPRELRNSVFEKFFTEELGRSTARRGYGLGLHLVKLAASAHRGTVEVFDNQGSGSIFRLRVPRVEEPASESELKTA